MKKIQYILCLLALAGCDKFLDKMPDNRAEIDTQQKIQALLVSAYPPTDYMLVTEFMSDNVDDYGTNNPYTDRFIDQVFAWDDVTESDNEDPESIWESSYHAIACANEAIFAIDSLSRIDPRWISPPSVPRLSCAGPTTTSSWSTCSASPTTRRPAPATSASPTWRSASPS